MGKQEVTDRLPGKISGFGLHQAVFTAGSSSRWKRKWSRRAPLAPTRPRGIFCLATPENFTPETTRELRPVTPSLASKSFQITSQIQHHQELPLNPITHHRSGANPRGRTPAARNSLQLDTKFILPSVKFICVVAHPGRLEWG